MTAVLLPIWIPLMMAVALMVAVGLGRPIFFRQTRAGLGGQPFTLFKFRTMVLSVGPWRPETDRDRLTGLGRVLRRWSLDELPQVANIIRGEMSWVGPRPLPVEYLPRYNRVQARRHEVVPGITGWAQINGRNSTDWAQRLAMDVWYVDHRSFRLDLQILLRTIAGVVRGSGVSDSSGVTMREFTGEN